MPHFSLAADYEKSRREQPLNPAAFYIYKGSTVFNLYSDFISAGVCLVVRIILFLSVLQAILHGRLLFGPEHLLWLRNTLPALYKAL